MIFGFVKRFFGSRNERLLRTYSRNVQRINALEASMAALSDEALKGKTAEFKQRLAGGATLDVDLDIECSSGTYVRAIARDLGSALGVGGHLTALRRTRIGQYSLHDAVVLGDEPPRLMSMAEAARLSFPVVDLTEDEARDVGFGRPLARPVPGGPTGVLSPDGELLALYEPAGSGSRPVAVLVGA